MTPRKANQPTLTREQIVAAAIAIVDRDGLEALSMRRLAAELGMSPMSLYYHVPDKQALYDLILDAVMAEVDLTIDDPARPAEERLIAAAYELRRALLAHPHAIQLALARSLHTPAQLRPVEALLAILFDAGFSAGSAMGVVNILGQFVFGLSAAYANHLTESEMHGQGGEEDYAALSPEQFPNIVAALSQAEHPGHDEDFDRGLRALVRGLLQ